MATLQTIRNRGGLLVSIVIGLALIAFIVGDALNSGASIFNSQRNEVGEIAGESISIMDYQNLVNKNLELVKLSNNGMSLSEDQQRMIRENTWQQMINERLMGQEYEELGITVTGEELYDMMLGDNMAPAVRQLFADPNTGAVDVNRARNIIKSLIEAPANTPQRAYWLNMEEEIATNRKMSKYNNLLVKSLFVTDEQAKANAENNADKADISYIVKNYSTIEDSTIQITNSEIKDYYENHKKNFEQAESRQIVYVNFDIDPSAEDYTAVENTLSAMIPEFTESTEAMDFAAISSDQKPDNGYYKKEEITNDSLAEFLFSHSNEVYGPYLENKSFKISRVASEKMLPDSVRARHILIQTPNALAIADSLVDLLKKGANFEELARANSADQNSAINGGDLGWFNQHQMVQPFSDSAFFAKKKDIKIVQTQFGIHILQVTDMAKPVRKIQVATIEKEVLPSAKTTNKIYSEARTFVTNVSTLDDFDKKVTEQNVTKRIATVGKNDMSIAGLDNARDLIRQVYMFDKPGEVVLTSEGSSIFETEDKYTIVVLTAITDEGVAPLNSTVASNIKRILTQKKKAEILKKEMETAMQGSESLLSIAQKLGLEPKEATEVTFNSYQIPGAGMEPKVIAAASETEQGKIAGPIEGNQGVYMVLVNNRTQEEVTPEMTEQAKQSLKQTNMYQTYQAYQAILKNGEIKDQRYKFY